MLAVLDLQSRKATWLTLPEAGGTEKEPRELRWSMPVLSDDGAVAVASVRSSDNKDRWLVRIDPATGKTTVLDHLHDDAWVREGFGPGPSSYGWLPASHRLWFTSERTGWMHLYVVDADAGGEARALTSGEWEITDVATSSGPSHVLPDHDGGEPGRASPLRRRHRRRGPDAPDDDDRIERGRDLARRQDDRVDLLGRQPPARGVRRGVWRDRTGDPRDDEPYRGMERRIAGSIRR